MSHHCGCVYCDMQMILWTNDFILVFVNKWWPIWPIRSLFKAATTTVKCCNFWTAIRYTCTNVGPNSHLLICEAVTQHWLVGSWIGCDHIGIRTTVYTHTHTPAIKIYTRINRKGSQWTGIMLKSRHSICYNTGQYAESYSSLNIDRSTSGARIPDQRLAPEMLTQRWAGRGSVSQPGQWYVYSVRVHIPRPDMSVHNDLPFSRTN